MKCSVEECEDVKISAPEAMRKCFLGIYVIEASEYTVSDTQRLILERLAAARLSDSLASSCKSAIGRMSVRNFQHRVILHSNVKKNGIAQNDLTEQLRIQANNVFYQSKKFETQGLIVRQPTIIRTKEASRNGEPKSDSTVTTNMLYLCRYGKHLSCQHRLEITKEDNLLVDCGIADGLSWKL